MIKMFVQCFIKGLKTGRHHSELKIETVFALSVYVRILESAAATCVRWSSAMAMDSALK